MKIKTPINLLIGGIVLVALANAFAQTTFTKVTSGDLPNDSGSFATAAWGDFNNDGFLDLFLAGVGNTDRTNSLYRNNGDGTFTRITQGDPVADTDYHISGAWGDYDNDGNLDLVVSPGAYAPTASRNLLFHNNGDGTFSRVSGGSVTNQLGFFALAAWADYDNDGFLDLFIADHGDSDNHGAKNLLFHNNGDGTFTLVASGAPVSDISVAWAVQWVDYDNDGFMDLLVVNNNYQTGNSVNFLYHNHRDGTFTRVLTNVVATDRWEGALCSTWGDYDNDGFQDLFVTAASGGQNRLYRNNGDGTFKEILSGLMLSPPPGAEARGCAWGDYDNDGYLDLFVTYAQGGNTLFHNKGDGTFTQVQSGDPVNDSGPDISFNIASWVDYDNDGFLDLLTSGGPDSAPAQKNYLYHNNGNSNAWLEIKCVGTVANRSAIGTKVRARATIGGKTFWQLREINNGGGWNAVPFVAHFGLGDAAMVDTVRIEWPSGTVQEFHNVVPKQNWTVTEPPRLLFGVANGTPQFTLRGGRGLQYDVQISTDLKSWSLLSTITITKLDGTALVTDAIFLSSDWRFYRAVLH